MFQSEIVKGTKNPNKSSFGMPAPKDFVKIKELENWVSCMELVYTNMLQ